jgi:hypothetical protein
MKKLIVCFLFISTGLFATEVKISDARMLFQKSAADETACKKLMSLVNTNGDGTITAYRACATMMMANHCFNPFIKLSYFNKGKAILEKCIAFESSNIETRFLRFTIQSSSPNFLGYNRSIQEDKIFLINNISGLPDPELKQMIISFLKSSQYLSENEKQYLRT